MRTHRWVSTCASLQCTCKQGEMLRYGMNETFRIHRLSVSSFQIADHFGFSSLPIWQKSSTNYLSIQKHMTRNLMLHMDWSFTRSVLALTKKGHESVKMLIRVYRSRQWKCGKKKRIQALLPWREEVMENFITKETQWTVRSEKKAWNISNTFWTVGIH